MSTWVFLRGLMREARHWGAFPAQFRARLPDADIVTLDFPGNGRLHRETSPVRVQDMVEHCRRTLRARGLVPPYHLLALSLGGMVAVAWNELYPQETRDSVLINTSMRPHNSFFQRLRPASYPALLGLAAGPRNIERQERSILQITSCRGAAQPDVLAAWVGYARECPVTRRNALRQLLAAARFCAPGGPRSARLLLAGAADRLVDPECSSRLARVWNADLRVHAHAGHDLPLDDGPWVAERVRDWLHSRG